LDTLPSKLAQTYATLQHRVSLRAEVSRRVARGEQWQESNRTYEATAAGTDLLIRVLDRGNEGITRLRGRNGSRLLILEFSKVYYEGTSGEAGALELDSRMDEIWERLFGRIVAWKQGSFSSAKLLKDQEITVAGTKILAKRIELKSKGASITAWIDPATNLVRRLNARLNGPRAEFIDETIHWTEIQQLPANAKLTIQPPEATAFQKKPLLQDKFPY
jgi:hypothetical protein